MTNKAFALFRGLVRSKMIEAHCFDELERRRIHPAVIDNLRHEVQRESSSARYSDVEAIGYDWRKRHGFGRPFLNIGGHGNYHGYKERQDAERRKAERARRKKQIGRRSTIMTGIRKIFRMEGRKT